MFATESLELDALTSDPGSPVDGMAWYNSTDGVFKIRLGGVTRVLRDSCKKRLSAVELISPVNADWAVNALAPVDVDPSNNALKIRLYDDTGEEGSGFEMKIPSLATRFRLHIESRAVTAPAGLRTIGVKLYTRGIPDNAAVESWSAGTQWNDINIPTNAYFQYDTETRTLASLSLTAGRLYQFELTRVTPSGGTDLEGDWGLLSVVAEFF